MAAFVCVACDLDSLVRPMRPLVSDPSAHSQRWCQVHKRSINQVRSPTKINKPLNDQRTPTLDSNSGNQKTQEDIKTLNSTSGSDSTNQRTVKASQPMNDTTLGPDYSEPKATVTTNGASPNLNSANRQRAVSARDHSPNLPRVNSDADRAICDVPETGTAETKLEQSYESGEYTLGTSESGVPGIFLETFHEPHRPVYENARIELPSLVVQREQVSIWSILKQSIGKYVTAFAVSTLSSNRERSSKPFNPLLGETYELDRRDDLGFRVVCEQVSHHPPTSAFYAEGADFTFTGSIMPKIKFWGKTAECQPKGVLTLKLLKHNETYTWSQVNASAHNLFMGKMYVDLTGLMEIHCQTTQLKACMQFKSSTNWYGKETTGTLVQGHIVDKHKHKIRALYGDWTEFLASCSVENFDHHFASWGKEHKERRDSNHSTRLQMPGVGGGGVAAPAGGLKPGVGGHSPPPNRRFSTIGVVTSPDSDASDGEDADEASVASAASQNQPIVHSKSTKHSRRTKEHKNCTDVRHLMVIPVLTGSEILWRTKPKPLNAEQFYNFTFYTMMLNEIDDTRHSNLPPTDSRFRPDVRYMEDGNTELAAQEKHRLEEKQREVRALRKKLKDVWKPKWFDTAAHEHKKDESTWIFNQKYFSRDWQLCDDLF